MFFKLLYILFLVNSIFSQSFFNRIQPEEIYLGDARSMSIGNILFTSNNSGILITNPAHMSSLDQGINFDFNIELNTLSERRGNQFKDMFGSFIGQSDYVFNQSNDFQYSFSLIFNSIVNKNKDSIWEFRENLSIGISYKPFSSFNYNYEEELRGAANSNVLGIRDPILGYHIFNTSGELYVQSLGISYKVKDENKKIKSVGFSLNQIKPTKIKDRIDIINFYDLSAIDEYHPDYNQYINCLNEFGDACNDFYINSEEVMVSMNSIENEYSFINVNKLPGFLNKDVFGTIGIEFRIKNDTFVSISYESPGKLFSSSNQSEIIYPNISNMVGLPQYIEYNDDNDLVYVIQGIKYYKPKVIRLGVSYIPRSMASLLIAFEIENKYWDISREGMNNNVNKFKAGIEYKPLDSFPIRAGLVYNQSSFTAIGPKTVLALGTGKTLGKATIDFAMNYSISNYRYIDIFPVIDNYYNSSCDVVTCDEVNESKLTFLTTIRMEF